MFKNLLMKIFGDRYQREMKEIEPYLNSIKKIYPELESLSDDELRKRIQDIKASLQQKLNPLHQELKVLEEKYQVEADESKRSSYGNEIDRLEKKLKKDTQEELNLFLPEVFAIVKDTCRRIKGSQFEVKGDILKWEMIPYDVQLIGGIALHLGRIAEMATGEGKTLVATMPLFLNALTGRGVHLVTVNDYLASRDAEWMSPIFNFHGLTVGKNVNGLDHDEKREAYNCDVTYGTNSEFGFDYLRDNMAVSEKQLVQRKLFYAIVDEVDSVLIDEARTPLIISGPVAESKNFFKELKPVIRKLVEQQNVLVRKFLGELRNELANEEWNGEVVGKLLLKIYRAAPKSKSFLKYMKQGDLKKVLQDWENHIIREKKMHEIDNELFYFVDERSKSVELSEQGTDYVSKYESDIFLVRQLDEILGEIDAMDLNPNEKQKRKESAQESFFDKNEKIHNIKQLLRAYTIFEKDVEYVVQQNKVMIVDEFTGRMMPGRRFSDGLHQALEAKEGCEIEEATQTFATITLQNFFRMYDKLAGMTGTAITEEGEFLEIYELPVMVIPTNEPVTRIDHDDLIYLTKNDKYQAIINEIEYWHNKGKPVLVGTINVDVSEKLGRLLARKKINHNILNAKYHEQEAEFVKIAGKPGAVTIATNMAGRGTDIKLGEGVVNHEHSVYQGLKKSLSEEFPFGQPLDGLHVIGTERHESRRIDRQLRGRAGRQGDPGTSRFYLSLEDDLMRIFGSERIAPMMMKIGLEPGEAITHPWMSKAVENAQKRVEGFNFGIRKQLIKYDEVMNQQREVIYRYRRNVLKGYDLQNEIKEMMKEAVADIVENVTNIDKYYENWNIEEIVESLKLEYSIKTNVEALKGITAENVLLNTIEIVEKAYFEREKMLGSHQMREIERRSLLTVVDSLWRDHLYEMDLLREGIGFRAYAQKDPLIEYKKESFDLFQELIYKINREVTKKVFTTYLLTKEQYEAMIKLQQMDMQHAESSAYRQAEKIPQQSPAMPNRAEPQKIKPRKVDKKIGRNEPCPCGSGKKYKNCCGKFQNEEI